MCKVFFLPVLAFSAFLANAQQTPAADSVSKNATVNVVVTNMKGQPRKGEAILFRSSKNGQVISGVSGTGGKFSLQLPPGDTYIISVKSLTDTTKYSQINVPALAEDEYFSEPFGVTIKFEPARNFRLDNVHFDTDKATLRADSYAELKELLDYLQRHEEVIIEIAGHTDDMGTAAHNLKLSQDRANTIRAFLLSKGIKAARVTAKGYGASEPVADNATEEGRKQNRRTEVRIL